MKTDDAALGRTTPPAGPDSATTHDLADELRRRLFTARLASWLADVALNTPTEDEDLIDEAA